MLFLKDVLSPSYQNATQRCGYFVTLALMVLVFFLHFPFNGYETEQKITKHYAGVGRCPNGLEDLDKMGARDFNQAMAQCNDRFETNTISLPFSEWKSKSPIVGWFAYPVHVLISMAFFLCIGIIWLWVFRAQDKAGEKTI